MNPEKRLTAFKKENKVVTKGPLSIIIQLTRAFYNKEFPLDPNDFKTEQEGQVTGLSGRNLKSILQSHGITQTLSAEGGRTSRGSLGLMTKYVHFLNNWKAEEDIDLNFIEEFWAKQIQNYFKSKPFVLSADNTKTISACFENLFDQARKREKQNQGTKYLGTILQHLVAAKLSVIMPKEAFDIHGASVADAPTNRSGDFTINDIIIHCTTMPGNPLIDKCRSNIEAGCNPVIITIQERVKTAFDLIKDSGLEGRINVWDIQQFLATNIYEHSKFDNKEFNNNLKKIIDKYNEIIQEKETDPSLQIEYTYRK